MSNYLLIANRQGLKGKFKPNEIANNKGNRVNELV
jgi:hypothetical protein